jgi:hypothetical protein
VRGGHRNLREFRSRLDWPVWLVQRAAAAAVVIWSPLLPCVGQCSLDSSVFSCTALVYTELTGNVKLANTTVYRQLFPLLFQFFQRALRG